jgi:hypothetical protein
VIRWPPPKRRRTALQQCDRPPHEFNEDLTSLHAHPPNSSGEPHTDSPASARQVSQPVLAPPPRPSPQHHSYRNQPSRPYTGDFRGTTWNAQALFAADVQRQVAKQDHVRRLISRYDFIMLQETHSTRGACLTWTPPAGTRFFPSHGTASMAGVGILVTHRFLSKFDAIPDSPGELRAHWQEIQPGRVARLALTGPGGTLHLVVCYFATGQARGQRNTTRAVLAQHFARLRRPLPLWRATSITRPGVATAF